MGSLSNQLTVYGFVQLFLMVEIAGILTLKRPLTVGVRIALLSG
jgi:hypothetical protein